MRINGMTRERIRGHCPRCGHQQIFEKNQIHHGVHLFLTIVTCGLWLVSWVSIFIGHQIRPWRCVQCGWHKPLFKTREAATDSERGDVD